MTTGTISLFDRAGREKVFSLDDHAHMVTRGQVGPGREWSSIAPPPANWDRVVPRYKVSLAVRPPQRARYRYEPPFEAGGTETDVWNYGERAYTTGEIIETKAWPHPTFVPLNYSAERVLQFFSTRMKSRLTLSPWHIDRLRLDDGLSGPSTPDVRPPDVKPMDLRPVA
jgi:hypothetical protein